MFNYVKVLKFISALFPLLNQGKKLDVEDLRVKSKKLHLLIEELGPTYIKLGQLLSVRYDLLHRETCTELQNLLDSGPPLKNSVIKQTIKKELGEKGDFLLKNLDLEPIAVASLGQVHTAKIGKEKVAVKIQKPEMFKLIKRDMGTLRRIIFISSLVPPIRRLQLNDIFKEFEKWTFKEIDYSIEATNMEKFGSIFSSDKTVYTPKVFREYSTDKILVTEFVEGPSIKELLSVFSNNDNDLNTYKGVAYSRRKVLDLFANNVFRQVFEKGFVHADPHPSNLKMKDENTICFIDFGITTSLSSNQIKIFKRFISDVVTSDVEDLVEGLLVMDQKPGVKSKEKLKQKLCEFFETYETSIAEQYSVTRFATEVMYLATGLGIQFPMFLTLLARVLAIYDGMLQVIAPKEDFLKIIYPYFEKQVVDDQIDKISPDNIKKEVLKEFKELESLKDLILQMPQDSLEIINDIKQNGLKINVYDPASHADDELKDNKFRIEIFFFLFLSTFIPFLVVGITRPNQEIGGVNVATSLLVSSVGILIATVIFIFRK